MPPSTNSKTPIPDEQLGYCARCRENSVQHRRIRSSFVRFVDRLSGGMLTLLGLGSWKCEQCGKLVWFHEPPCEMVGTDPANDMDDCNSQSIGNFIRRERDLIAIAARLDRFTEKFRESILDRLFSGQVDLRTLREDLNVSEADLLAMIAERFKRLESRIDKLQDILKETSTENSCTPDLIETKYLTSERDDPSHFHPPRRNCK